MFKLILGGIIAVSLTISACLCHADATSRKERPASTAKETDTADDDEEAASTDDVTTETADTPNTTIIDLTSLNDISDNTLWRDPPTPIITFGDVDDVIVDDFVGKNNTLDHDDTPYIHPTEFVVGTTVDGEVFEIPVVRISRDTIITGNGMRIVRAKH